MRGHGPQVFGAVRVAPSGTLPASLHCPVTISLADLERIS
jgi:hypothetical protein